MALAKPTVYHNNKKKLNRSAKISIAISWAASFFIGFVTAMRWIPGDKFQVHPMGMILSKKMDELYLYEALIVVMIFLLWLIYTISRVTDRRNSKKSLARSKASKTSKKEKMKDSKFST